MNPTTKVSKAQRVVTVTTFRLALIVMGTVMMYLSFNYEMINIESQTTFTVYSGKVWMFAFALTAFALAFGTSANKIVRFFILDK